METRDKVKGYIQQTKEDWWGCIYCPTKQHRGFPYTCDNIKAKIERHRKFIKRMKFYE